MTVLLSDVWVDHHNDELVIDWSNDRHQAVKFHSREPRDVISALEDVVFHLKKELLSGYLDAVNEDVPDNSSWVPDYTKGPPNSSVKNNSKEVIKFYDDAGNGFVKVKEDI